jgi:hypothetical protein
VPSFVPSLRALALVVPLLTPAAGAAARGSEADGSGERAVAAVKISSPAGALRAGERVEVGVSVLDARGAPVDAPDVTLGCLVGEVGPLERVREGVHRATFTAPKVLPRVRSALLFASAGGYAGEQVVALAAGPASTLSINGPDVVLASEADQLRLSVAVLDADGNPAEDEVQARATAGTLEAARVGPGLWMVAFRPPPGADDFEDAVDVAAGDARASHPLLLSRGDRWIAVAPWAGAVLGPTTGAAAGATASAWWHTAPDEVGLLLDLGVWRLRDRAEVALPGGSAGLTGERTYVPLTASFAWGHLLGRTLETVVGAGAGAALVLSSQQLAGQPAVEEAGWAPLGVLSAGFGWRLGRGLAFVDARGVWIGDAGLSTLSGPSRALLLVAGYRYDAR